MQNIHLPSIDRINKFIIVALVTLFLINSSARFMHFSLVPLLGLSLDQLMAGKVWTLITYSFLPSGLIEIIFNALIIWFIGSELSQMWGEKRYLQFLASSILGGAIIGLGVSTFTSHAALLLGASALCSSLCVAYGILNPERTMYFFFFPLQAKWFVILLIAMNLYSGIFSGAANAFSQLGAMASGYAWMIFVSRQKKNTKRKKFKQNNKSHLRIVEDDQQEPPTYH